MTADEKVIYLTIAREMVRQAEPQADTRGYEELRQNIINEAGKSSFMREDYMTLVNLVSDIIASHQQRIQGMRDVVTYIEQTPPAELTAEDIGARLKKYSQPE